MKTAITIGIVTLIYLAILFIVKHLGGHDDAVLYGMALLLAYLSYDVLNREKK